MKWRSINGWICQWLKEDKRQGSENLTLNHCRAWPDGGDLRARSKNKSSLEEDHIIQSIESSLQYSYATHSTLSKTTRQEIAREDKNPTEMTGDRTRPRGHVDTGTVRENSKTSMLPCSQENTGKELKTI